MSSWRSVPNVVTHFSLKLEDAKVLVVDSQLHTRRLLKDALHMIGFRKMKDIRKVEELAGAVVSYEPDLIMIDIDEQREYVCQSIKAIRNRKLGSNPFVAIVALTWQPEKKAIGEVLAAGTLPLVTASFSLGQDTTSFSLSLAGIVTLTQVSQIALRPNDLPSPILT